MEAEAAPFGVQVQPHSGVDAQVSHPQAPCFEAGDCGAAGVGLQAVVVQGVHDHALGWSPEASAELFLLFG